MKRWLIETSAAVALVFATALPSLALDTIKTESDTLTGRIVAMTANEVTLDQSGVQQKVPVNKIESISFGGDEPAALRTIRTYVSEGRFQDAQSALERIQVSSVSRPEVKEEIAFLSAYVAARVALESGGSIAEAGQQMAAFESGSPNNWHHWEAARIVGDLLMAVDKPETAESYYAKLAQAPWPEYKLESNVLVGWAKLAAGKPSEAAAAFDAAVQLAGQVPGADRLGVMANIGKAQCLAEEGKTDEALAILEPILARPDLADDVELAARTYNAIGTAYRKANKPKDAVLAFLHVDLLYSQFAQGHITALENLVQLWPQLQRPDRAARAAEILRQRYGRTPPSG
ncbi:hypothetical protein JCM19992_13830 [Thermostilla marina]